MNTDRDPDPVRLVLTYSQPGRGSLGVLAVVVVKLEQVLHLPVRQQRAGQAEHDREAAVDAAEPDRKPGGLQHAAHLQTEQGGFTLKLKTRSDAGPVSWPGVGEHTITAGLN